jgi:thiol-disulfide isomerase/thioredoxin
MRHFTLLAFLGTWFSISHAQTGYDIRITFKGCPDTTVYLARYYWDQLPIMDSAKKVKNGKIHFSGKEALPKGVYFLANQARSSYYFQFIVDADQHFTVSADNADIAGSLKSDEKQNDQFFSYIRFMTGKNKEMAAYHEQSKSMKKADSAKFMSEKQKLLNEQTTRYDKEFMARNKGTFLYDVMNLKSERYATDVPLASNGRPDSIYQYFYYKSHFFDGANLRDDRTLSTPFFAEKVKRYFDQLVAQHPDSVIKETDKILKQTIPGSTLYQVLVGYFTYKAEQNKTMSFDATGKLNTYEKVFVHMANNYITGGHMKGYYEDETIEKIREKANVLSHLLPDAKVSDLNMIDTTYGRYVLKMGFDTAKTSYGVTHLYNRNLDKLLPIFRSLYKVNAKYTVLVFWAVDCGHCKTEVPKLHEELQKLKGEVDVKVYAVQTKEDLYDDWRRFIAEKQLTGFIHVFDPVHLNNLKEQFDIVATPVIYLLDKDKRIKGKKLAHDQVVDIIRNLEKIEKNKTSK